MEKMYISFLKDLKNPEFHELFSQIDARLDDENFENSPLQELAKKIKHHNKQLLLLKHAKPGHPLTAVINEKIRTRTEYLAFLRMTVDANMLTYIPENRVAAAKLKFWLSNYKKDLYRSSYSMQTGIIMSMMQDRKQEPYVKEAIAQLQLDGLMDAILQITEDINKDRDQRLREKVYNTSVVAGLRENAYKDLQMLVQALPIFHSLADDQEKERLSRLSRGINIRLTSFRTVLRSRRTKSKNKRELDTAVEQLIDTSKESTPAKSNLPMVIYDVLKIDKTDKNPTSQARKPTHKERETATADDKKNQLKHRQISKPKSARNTSLTKRDKRKGGDGKLLPIENE